MRHTTLVLALLAASMPGCLQLPARAPVETISPGEASSRSDQILHRAFEEQAGNLLVEGEGSVKRLLPDDNDGSRHQRFTLELGSGQTLLVAHNVDVAPRIPGLQTGDKVTFRGEYEWNPEGGVIHWTHDDPAGRHPGGWLRHKGRTYR